MIPTAETPPAGLDAYWLGVWRHALKTMKAQDTWTWEQKPLLDEYVFALMRAQDTREYMQDANWDRAMKRATALAHVLILTPEAQKKHGIGADDEGEDDGFAALDAEDELARRRKAG